MNQNYEEVVRIEHTQRIERANRDGWWLHPQDSTRTPLRVKLAGVIVALGTKF